MEEIVYSELILSGWSRTHSLELLGWVQFSSGAQSSPTLCNPMDCSTPGFAVHHQFPELAQTQVHRVCDAIQPSHPLSSPSPLAFNLSQPQGLFPVSVLPMNMQDWFPWGVTGLMSLQSKELSRVFSNTTDLKYQFFSTQLSLWPNSHIHTWLLEKTWLWLDQFCQQSYSLCFWICCLGWP